MLRTLLVPVDFHPPSLQALRHAADVVRAVGGWVHVLHVLEDKEDPQQVQETLCALATTHRRAPLLLLEPGDGHPVDEVILAVARRCGADLLIVGPHGGSALREGRLGQVAQRLLLHSPIPVYVVPETLEPRTAGRGWGRTVSPVLASPHPEP